jgi:hypothetical protein
LLVYLLSLPADWDIRVSHLQSQGDAGRDALRRMLHELQEYGYASGVGRENQERSERGRFGRQMEIRVYESPALNPYYSEERSPSPEKPSTVRPPTDSPLTAQPSPEKPSSYKEHNQQSTQETKKHTQRHLRAAGAPEERVCVDSFPTKTYERYALNHPTEIRNPVGWASKAKKTGQWDETVARWCAEHGVDPSTGENLAKASDEPTRSTASERKCTPECPQCFGTGWESVPGKGARRCPNLTAQRQAA